MLNRTLLMVAASAFAVSTAPPSFAQAVVVVGDSAGNVTMRDLADTTLSAVNLDGTSIGQIDAVDVDGDGRLEVLVTHQESLDLPTYCLNLPWLTQRWITDYPTRFGLERPDSTRTYWSDFDGDGELELLIPLGGQEANSTLYQVFSALDGHRECAFPDLTDSLAVAYYDPVDSAWKLAGEKAPDGFTHDLYKYALANCPSSFECANTSVNMWQMGAIGTSMIDGEPRIWGGWYGRTLYVTDRSCNTLWSKSFGGGFEAAGTYAGDLRGDGVETLLVEGTYGWNQVRLDAAMMSDGTTLWTFDDTDADWALHVIAVEDVDHDGVKEVFVHTGGNESHPAKYQAISGADGTRLWQEPYPFDTWMVVDGRLADVNGDGAKELLIIVNNTIEARNALTGALVRTYTFSANVTAFELATVAAPGWGWMNRGVPGPSSRTNHAMAYDSAWGMTVLFGGEDPDSAFGDTWEWPGDSWSQPPPPPPAPSPRTHHALAYDSARGVSVLFGGFAPYYPYYLGDTWEWDGNDWTQVSADGPSPRHLHAAAYDSARGVTVLFGGTGLGEFWEIYGDTWEWNGNTWARVSTEGPSPRYEHALAYDSVRGVTVLFGGWDGSAYYGDTWELGGNGWTLVSTDGPCPRRGHGMAYDSARGVTVLFGGDNAPPGNHSYLGDTWEWDGNDWTQVSTDGPSPRRTTLAYDSARRVTVLFGGDDGVVKDDTWEYGIDCNSNNVPDADDIAGETSQDCNGNGVPDECDLAAGTSTDVNSNGIPDECESVGDLNCDGSVNFGDINPFVMAIANPDLYAATYANCPLENRDINGDSHVDFGDINPFVWLLTHMP
jgi:hypothetical protein